MKRGMTWQNHEAKVAAGEKSPAENKQKQAKQKLPAMVVGECLGRSLCPFVFKGIESCIAEDEG